MKRKRLGLGRIGCLVGYGVVGVLAAWTAWAVAPGLPVTRAPRASAGELAAGRTLFEHEWQANDPLARGDGLGPVFNGKSCVECHFQGGVGGAGGAKQNIITFEAHPTRDDPVVRDGAVHKFAVDDKYFEGQRVLHAFFPVTPGGAKVRLGCQLVSKDFNRIHTEHVNTTALFGDGWIDRISARSILHEHRKRAAALIGREIAADFAGIPAGRPRTLPDGRLGKFGWKAQFATLEEFVAAACANEIGLGNPKMPQAKPLVVCEYPDAAPDLDTTQFKALVSFVDTLPRPQAVPPADPVAREQTERGQALFGAIGCASCHTPDVGGVAGIYSDFMLHRLDDANGSGEYGREIPEVPLPAEHPLPAEWKTPPLWGVADSAPYFHDGSSPTLEDAIQRHLGDATRATEAYKTLSPRDQAAVVRFLKTLRAPAPKDRLALAQ